MSLFSPGTDESHNKVTNTSRMNMKVPHSDDNSLAKAVDKRVGVASLDTVSCNQSTETKSKGSDEEGDNDSSDLVNNNEGLSPRSVGWDDSVDIVFENSGSPAKIGKWTTNSSDSEDASEAPAPPHSFVATVRRRNTEKINRSTDTSVYNNNNSNYNNHNTDGDISSVVNQREVGNSQSIVFEDSGYVNKSVLMVQSTQSNVNKSSQGTSTQNKSDDNSADQLKVGKRRRVLSQPTKQPSGGERPRTLSLGSSWEKVSPSNKEEAKPQYSRTFLYIQMELCQKESLKDWLLQNLTREQKFVFNIFNDIVRAVEYVHDNQLMHRDLKVFIYSI